MLEVGCKDEAFCGGMRDERNKEWRRLRHGEAGIAPPQLVFLLGGQHSPPSAARAPLGELHLVLTHTVGPPPVHPGGEKCSPSKGP